MTDVRITAMLVDGSALDFYCAPRCIQDLERLERKGYSGKALIDRAITDDWAAPPLFIDIHETSADGRTIKRRIPYD